MDISAIFGILLCRTDTHRSCCSYSTTSFPSRMYLLPILAA